MHDAWPSPGLVYYIGLYIFGGSCPLTDFCQVQNSLYVPGFAFCYSRSVTARHSISVRQPNFAALNRGRHLYSAGRPSRWALADISSWRLFCVVHFQQAACSTFQTCILNSHYGHTISASMADIHSATAEIRRGKKDRKKDR